MSRRDRFVEQMIKQNNELREQLTDENKAYYEDLLLYIRTAGLFYDDHEVESLLLQILQDIRSAQEDGQSAESFFGKNPREAADALIHQLGRASWKETLKLIGLIFGVSSFFVIFSELTWPGKGINMFVILLNGLLSVVVIGLVFFIMHKGIYVKLKNKWMSNVLLILFTSAALVSFILIQVLIPPVMMFELPNPLAIVTILVLLIGVTAGIAACDREDRRMWGAFIPPVYILGLIGIAARLPVSGSWLNGDSGRMTAVVLIVLSMALFWLLTYVNLREKKKES